MRERTNIFSKNYNLVLIFLIIFVYTVISDVNTIIEVY